MSENDMIEPPSGAQQKLVSVVVPVYDSPAADRLADGIAAVLRGAGVAYEIIFVDDGSPDRRIWPLLESLARTRPHVRAVQLSRNFGQQAATLCGLLEARGDLVITMDDDLQHDPSEIPLLLGQAHHDIVIGQFAQKEHPLPRRLGSRIKNLFDRIVIGTPPGLQLNSFRLMSRTVVDGVLAMRTPHPFLPALMLHVSRDVVGVAVSHGARAGGRSGYTIRKLLRHFSNLLVNNSSLLLRTAASVGTMFAAISFAVAGVVIWRKIMYGTAVAGWSSLIGALLLIGGLLLVSIGVVGEYLIRIVEGVEAKPTYFVRRRT